MRKLFFATVVLLFISCGSYLNKSVNPYYFGMTNIDTQTYKKNKDVKFYFYTKDNVKYFLKKGYTIKSKSAFRDRYVHPDWAKLAAKQVGADVMLLDKDYVGSVSRKGVLKWKVPGDTYRVTSSTNGNVNYNSNTDTYIYGNNWDAYGTSSTYGNINHNSTTTTTLKAPDRYSYRTVSYQSHYYDHYAVFMVKKYYWVVHDATYYKDKSLKSGNEKVKAGEWFEILESKGKYHQIIYNGTLGYINKDVEMY